MSAGHVLIPGSARPRAVVGFAALLTCLLSTPALAQNSGGRPTGPKDTEQARQPTDEELVRLPRDHEYFQFVQDEGPFLHRGKPITDAKLGYAAEMELKAYDYVLAHARRQPLERLRQHSIKNVPVENLFRPIKQDYLRELLHFEGRLSLVLATKPTEDLRKLESVDQLYEAWITPRGSNKFVVLVVSELPEGIKPGERQTANVAFDGYYFKLFHYESREPKDRADPEKKQWHKAPMFLGRTFDVTAADPPVPTYSPMMLAVVVAGLGVVVLIAVVMGVWFRRGDRRIQAGTRERLQQNVSFDEFPGPGGPVNRIQDQW
jgi:hypothetical protein